jgi:hypothetical protein
MDAVGADKKVGLEFRTIVECEPDSVAAVGHGDRTGTEPQVDLRRQLLAQHALEVGPHEAQQGALANCAGSTPARR